MIPELMEELKSSQTKESEHSDCQRELQRLQSKLMQTQELLRAAYRDPLHKDSEESDRSSSSNDSEMEKLHRPARLHRVKRVEKE